MSFDKNFTIRAIHDPNKDDDSDGLTYSQEVALGTSDNNPIPTWRVYRLGRVYRRSDPAVQGCDRSKPTVYGEHLMEMDLISREVIDTERFLEQLHRKIVGWKTMECL